MDRHIIHHKSPKQTREDMRGGARRGEARRGETEEKGAGGRESLSRGSIGQSTHNKVVKVNLEETEKRRKWTDTSSITRVRTQTREGTREARRGEARQKKMEQGGESTS